MKKYLLTLSTLVVLTANPSIGFSADTFTEEEIEKEDGKFADTFTEEEMVRRLKIGEGLKLEGAGFNEWFYTNGSPALRNLHSRNQLKEETLAYLFKIGQRPLSYISSFTFLTHSYLSSSEHIINMARAILVKHKYAPLTPILIAEHEKIRAENAKYAKMYAEYNKMTAVRAANALKDKGIGGTTWRIVLMNQHRKYFDSFDLNPRNLELREFYRDSLTHEDRIVRENAAACIRELEDNPNPTIIGFVKGLQVELPANTSAQDQGGESKNMLDGR